MGNCPSEIEEEGSLGILLDELQRLLRDEIAGFLHASCVCFALLQAAQALGFGAQWLTGWPAYDEPVLRMLGLAGHERIAGFIHIGTPAQQVPERERPDAATLLSDWNPA